MPDYYEISLSLTKRCNARCEHCCVDASPSCKQRLSLNQIRRLIDAAAEYGIKFLAFTGGEVTLHYADLLLALEQGHSLGLRNIVVTNGHWGRDPIIAERVAADLARRGTIEVQVSADMFHAKFVPFASVLRAVQAVRDNGMKPIVMLARVRDDAETESYKKELTSRGITIVEQPVMPFSGRSQHLPKDRLQQYDIDHVRKIGCISVLSPTVAPDGRLFACCASDFSASGNSPLVLGHTQAQSLSALLEQHRVDPILDALYLWGPGFLFDLINDEFRDMTGLIRRRLFGYCDLCYQLLTNSRIVRFLTIALDRSDIKRQIAIGKVVKHEKIRLNEDRTPDWYECVVEREET